jgi:glycine dehydrogenase subunit 1
MTSYTALTDADRTAMLAEIGVASADELYSDIPAALRLDRALDLPRGLSELEVYAELRRLAALNTSCDDEISFVGAGMYDHYVPAVVDAIASRSEFLTPYTPYQPEVSQGGLQVMFEYQTAICELAGLPVSNASMYDGPSAVAAAGYLARLENGRSGFIVSRGLHPHSREALKTTAAGWDVTIDEVELTAGATDLAALCELLGDETSAVFVQQPNFLGAVEDLAAIAECVHEAGALLVCACDPITLAILRAPGDCGADIVVGEGQPLGNRLDFGGPSFGFFAAREEFVRRMPGRIAGEAWDLEGRRGYVLTLQTREQHIRRERATSNICTSQALNALCGMIYLAWLGRQGFVDLATLLAQRTRYASERLAAIDGIRALHHEPVVREFAVEVEAPIDRVIEHCVSRGVNPGFPLGTDYPEHPNGLLIALTERRTRGDIDRLAHLLAAAVAAHRFSEARDQQAACS